MVNVEEKSSFDAKVCVVIPAYRVKRHILPLIRQIGPEVHTIIVVDDACPENSGQHVLNENEDIRVHVIFHETNRGVGGSVKTGYERALAVGANIIVKLDGDGQMNPALIKTLIEPIQNKNADYVKGNRFWSLENLRQMPKIRLLGNLVLSFFTKASSGYWNIFDPNNGFTAISAKKLRNLSLEKLENRYFFESDLLLHLYLDNSRVTQVSMMAKYESEESNLSVLKAVPEFLWKNTRNLGKRLFYTYFLRDFSVASVSLFAGSVLMFFSSVRGLSAWVHGIKSVSETSPGTQMLVAITFLSGLQLLLNFITIDVNRKIGN